MKILNMRASLFDEEAIIGSPIALVTGASRGLDAAILAHLQALNDDRFVYGAQKAYKLSKAGMNGYTRYAARRYKMVNFLAICPGDVDTQMRDLEAAEVISAEEAVKLMGEVFHVRREWSHENGGFWRFGRRIDW